MTGLPLSAVFKLAWPDLTEESAQGYASEYRDIYTREVIPAT